MQRRSPRNPPCKRKAPRKRPRALRPQDADSAPDEVICLLCGRAFRAIRVKHLRAVHGFDGEHPVEDYKRRFGLRVAACEETCRLLADLGIDRAIREGRRWTRSRIRRELRARVRAGESVAPKRLGPPLENAIRRLVGSWEQAMREAGLDPDTHRSHRSWDNARVVEAIRKRRSEGKPLSSAAVWNDQPALRRAGIRRYGSWGATLRAAGFDPKEHRVTKWSLEKAREWIRDRQAAGLPITAGHVPSGLYGRVTNAVEGGWTAFVESLGISYPGQRKRRWSDEGVLDEIRRLKRRGRRLLASAVVQTQGQGLLKQARQRFGSWADALIAAGLDPLEVWRSVPWSRRSIVETIRARKRAGLTVDRRDVRKQDENLVRAAGRHFTGGWPEALAAAGPTRGGPAWSQARRRPPNDRRQ